jgi:hypothetical protein
MTIQQLADFDFEITQNACDLDALKADFADPASTLHIDAFNARCAELNTKAKALQRKRAEVLRRDLAEIQREHAAGRMPLATFLAKRAALENVGKLPAEQIKVAPAPRRLAPSMDAAARKAIRSRLKEARDAGDADRMLAIMEEQDYDVARVSDALEAIQQFLDESGAEGWQRIATHCLARFTQIEDLIQMAGTRRRALERRIDALEQRPQFSDAGVFQEGKAYRQGEGVTFGGSYFLAQRDVPLGKPGESADWRLIVKRGRDGKDAEQPRRS